MIKHIHEKDLQKHYKKNVYSIRINSHHNIIDTDFYYGHLIFKNGKKINV
jgi:hypothetical protein